MAKKRPPEIKRASNKPIEVAKAASTQVATPPSTPAVPATPTKSSNRFFASTWGKIISGLLIFFALFTIGYGIWRLSGGSFKPKTACPDAAKETSLRDTATANPGNFSNQLEYGTYLYNQCRKFDAAIPPLQNATKLADQPGAAVNVTDKAKAHLTLGLAYLYNQNSQAAKTEFTTTVNLDPKNPLGLYMLASSIKNDDPKRALTLFNQAAELEPNSDLGKSARDQANELAGK